MPRRFPLENKKRNRKMKRFGKRLMACLLAVIMTVNLLPAPALAALWDNSAEYSREILAELRELCGSEDEARSYST